MILFNWDCLICNAKELMQIVPNIHELYTNLLVVIAGNKDHKSISGKDENERMIDFFTRFINNNTYQKSFRIW